MDGRSSRQAPAGMQHKEACTGGGTWGRMGAHGGRLQVYASNNQQIGTLTHQGAHADASMGCVGLPHGAAASRHTATAPPPQHLSAAVLYHRKEALKQP